MNLPSFMPGSPALPVTAVAAGFDYGRALSLREMAGQYTELPKYLLALLHSLPDWHQHAFINTLWNAGARLNEALALRRLDFHLNDEIPHVVIRTAKQRRAGGGRPKKGKSANRMVPLSDPAYVDEMRRLFASTKEQFEDDIITGERRALPVWSVSGSVLPSARTRSATVLRCTSCMAMSIPKLFRGLWGMKSLSQPRCIRRFSRLMWLPARTSGLPWTHMTRCSCCAD